MASVAWAEGVIRYQRFNLLLMNKLASTSRVVTREASVACWVAGNSPEAGANSSGDVGNASLLALDALHSAKRKCPQILDILRESLAFHVCVGGVAEEEGFEPPIPFQVRQFSRLEPSTTRPLFLFEV